MEYSNKDLLKPRHIYCIDFKRYASDYVMLTFLKSLYATMNCI